MRESHAQHTTLAVSEDDNGLRLDRYLCQNFPELKRVTIHKMIRLGAIKVDSHKSKPFLRLSPGM